MACCLFFSGCTNKKTDSNDYGGASLINQPFSITDFEYIECGKTTIQDVHKKNGFYSNVIIAFGRGKGELYPTRESDKYICLLYDNDDVIIDVFIHNTENRFIKESIAIIPCQ